MSPKTKDTLIVTLVLIAVAIPPCYIGYVFVQDTRAIAAKGDVLSSFWLPKDAKVFTDSKEYYKLFEKRSPLFMEVPINRYKEVIPETAHHLVLVTDGEVHYNCDQGVVRIRCTEKLSCPHFVDIKSFHYLGNGNVKWEVSSGTMGYVGAIVGAFFIGIVADVMCALVIGIVWFVGAFIRDSIIDRKLLKG